MFVLAISRPSLNIGRRGVVVKAFYSQSRGPVFHFHLRHLVFLGKFGHEIFSTANPSLPLFHVGQLPVTGEGICSVLVIRLGQRSKSAQEE